ncbi:hypothetical protein LRX75_21440 [Rhizobium sp. DKSPLA3]|uniref:Helix-turn-helix domain-containing protein n=1 Tax=Rhizobium quercicola TaxID=2901226 RepID=A0A9X1NYI5_9HYPH|nr:hypothetical protein [Rhizobium quercicola]MCD7111603.1 hypothetical protein [Rhizobium quercicola]
MTQSTVTPRLLTKSQAAAYCGLSISTFGGVCPVRAVALGDSVRMHRYDVRDLDAWIDSFKSGQPAGKSALRSALDRLSSPTELDDRHVKVLRFMRDHPECETAAEIPGAGETTLAMLAGKSMVRELAKDAKGKRRFTLTKDGKAEMRKIEAWELEGRR